MSDELINLPESKEDISPQEKEIINSLFGNPSAHPEYVKPPFNWKLIGCTTILFVALANPWIDELMSKMPYCDNPIIIFGIKVILFLVIFIVMNYFM